MAYICCKGCYTEPCDNCGRQLCPTSGHRQGDSDREGNGWYCNSCLQHMEYKKTQKNYRELPKKVFNDLTNLFNQDRQYNRREIINKIIDVLSEYDSSIGYNSSDDE